MTEFPIDITNLGKVLAVCDAKQFINPLFTGKQLSDKLFIIAPKIKDLIYRDVNAKVSYARTIGLSEKYYYLRLNEVQPTLEDPFFMSLMAPDSAYLFQTDSFKEFKPKFEATILWKEQVTKLYPSLISLLDSYYSNSRFFSLPERSGSDITDIKQNDYSHLSSVLVNLLRVYFKFSGRQDWFWNEELINTGVLFYLSGLKSSAAFKTMLQELNTMSDIETKTITSTPAEVISSFLYSELLKENN